jgi:hypothetical protein
MTRQDYMTHLGLAVAFLTILAPYLAHHGLSLGSGLYFAGLTSQLAIASAARLKGGAP